MFRVRWEETALNELAAHLTDAPSPLRQRITAATNHLDALLRDDPFRESESRPEGRHVLFVSPLGVTFRVEADGTTVSVLRIWLFRQRR